MITADAIRVLLTGLMACVVFTGTVQMWMRYAFGLAFGIVSGLAIPAENSIVPVLLQADELQAADSLIMGLTQPVRSWRASALSPAARRLGCTFGQIRAMI